jgi:predicted metal-dependent phosphoesterase TrpH
MGYVKDLKTVFKRFLIKGKPGLRHPPVGRTWPMPSRWIRAAGGVAVLAHPGRYDMGRGKMELPCSPTSRQRAASAVEVVTASHTPDQVPIYARYAQDYGLLASCGSDFHAPGEGGRELGRMPAHAARLRAQSGWTGPRR